MDESVQKHLEQVADMSILVKRILDAAAYIEDHGWCQNRMTDEAGRVCVGGAIYAVTGGYRPGDMTCPLQQSVFGVVNRALGGSLAIYNDRVGMTKDQVVAKLRAVALSQ